MKKSYQPRPAGRHVVDPKTGKRTRSGDFTREAGEVSPAAPVSSSPSEKQPVLPVDKKGN